MMQVALPVVGEVPAADDFQPAILRVIRGSVRAECAASAGLRWRVARPVTTCVDAFAARPVGDERLAVVVEGVAPRVPPAAHEHVEFAVVSGLNRQMPPALSRFTPRRRFDVAVDVHRLVEVEPASPDPSGRCE